jgi:hypothetical protein
VRTYSFCNEHRLRVKMYSVCLYFYLLQSKPVEGDFGYTSTEVPSLLRMTLATQLPKR